MLDVSKLKEYAAHWLGVYKNAFNLQEWHVETHFNLLSGTDAAQVNFNSVYKYAHVTFDPTKHDDEEDVARNARHEMIHLLLAPFETSRKALLTMLPEQFHETERELDRQACEFAVRAFENALDNGMGIKPLQMGVKPAANHTETKGV